MSDRDPTAPCCEKPTEDEARCYYDIGHPGPCKSRYCGEAFATGDDGKVFYCDRPPNHQYGPCEADNHYDYLRGRR